MKTLGLIVLLIVSVPLAAQSANGDFQYALTGATGSIQFNARQHGNSASGQMTFTGAAEISNEDGDGGTGNTQTGASMTVSFNCLKRTGNQAAMSGVITASSVAEYVGLRAVLAVEDGGEGSKGGPDKFTWGLYRSTAMSWTPSDAEVTGDNGWSFSWYASDAERNDDVPVPINQSAPNLGVDCKSFPLGSYAYEELAHGSGNIQVRP